MYLVYIITILFKIVSFRRLENEGVSVAINMIILCAPSLEKEDLAQFK